MSWEILLAISIFTSISWTLLQRVLMKDEASDPVAFSIVANLIAGLIIAIFSFIKGFSTANIQDVIPNLLLMVVLYGVASLFMFRSMKLIEASQFTIFFTTRALWSAFAAVIFLHETFLPSQLAGTVLILIGVALVSLKSYKFKIGKGEIFALLCAAGIGLHFINGAVILQKVDVFLYTPLFFIVPNIFIWAIYPKSTKKIISLFTSPLLPKILLLGAFFAISGLTYQMAYQVGRNAAQIASINQTQTIITVVAATIILNERKDYLKKIIASTLTFVGILLVI